MSNHQVFAARTDDPNTNNGDESNFIRDIHALTPSSILPPPPPTNSHPLGTYLSMASSATDRDDFSNMSVTNSTLVVAGSAMGSMRLQSVDGGAGDQEYYEVDGNLLQPSNLPPGEHGREVVVAPVTSVKKEEVESKITAWKNAKIAEINNRFKCEDAIIKGWEMEKFQKATLRMKQVERKLEEKKARAMEKMENEIAKAHQKAEERRASAESVRGSKMARVLEVANLMKAVGRSPVKKLF